MLLVHCSIEWSIRWHLALSVSELPCYTYVESMYEWEHDDFKDMWGELMRAHIIHHWQHMWTHWTSALVY